MRRALLGPKDILRFEVRKTNYLLHYVNIGCFRIRVTPTSVVASDPFQKTQEKKPSYFRIHGMQCPPRFHNTASLPTANKPPMIHLACFRSALLIPTATPQQPYMQIKRSVTQRLGYTAPTLPQPPLPCMWPMQKLKELLFSCGSRRRVLQRVLLTGFYRISRIPADIPILPRRGSEIFTILEKSNPTTHNP